MPYEVLVKEAHTIIDEIPREKIGFVVGVLKNFDFSNEATAPNPKKILGRKFGIAKTKDYWISPNFNETPEDFKDYL